MCLGMPLLLLRSAEAVYAVFWVFFFTLKISCLNSVCEQCSGFRKWSALAWSARMFKELFWHTTPAVQTSDWKLIQQRACVLLLPSESQSSDLFCFLTYVRALEVGHSTLIQNSVCCYWVLSLLVWAALLELVWCVWDWRMCSSVLSDFSFR